MNGGMNGEAIIAVSAAVVALTQLVKWAGLRDNLGPLAVIALSALGVVFWGWSAGQFTRATSFSYFEGWISVATSAAGIFGFTRAASGAVTNYKSPPAGGAGSNPTM